MDGLLFFIMAWNVNVVYDFLKFLIRKNQAGSISASNYFFAWNSEQTQLFKDLKGRFQARSNGKAGANTGLIENETIETSLSPFTKNVTIAVASGIADIPSDFSYLLALRVNGYDVRHFNKNQKAAIVDSVIDAPSIPNNSYYYTPYGSTYLVLPTTVTEIEMDYLANPTDVVWAFTLDGNGRQVYTSAGSSQPQWLQDDIIEITKRALKTLGVSYHDNDFSQFGNSVINTGN